MGKNIVSFGFLAISAIAIYLFAFREDVVLRDQISGQDRRPRITLEEFTIHRYHNHQVLKTLTGQIANFMDPNLLEMYGKIRGLSYDSANREYFSAESATIYFESTGVVQLLENSKVRTADIENEVNVGSQDKLIKTQYAQYQALEEILHSDVPVVLTAPNGTLKGKSGFEYDLTTEDLVMYGPIQGTLQSESIP